MTSATKEIDVRYSCLAISPLEVFKSYLYFAELAKKLGYTSLELAPIIGAMMWNLNQLADEKELMIGSVHSHPNFGYKNLWSLLKEDPLRPGQRLSVYNLAMLPHEQARSFIRKLNEAIPALGVVVYPHMGYELRTDNDWMQTHPAVFGDTHNADDLIKLVKQKAFAGVVWDTAHAIESAGKVDGNEYYPHGETTRESLVSLEKLLRADVIREVHLQVGRQEHDYRGDMGLEQLGRVIGALGKDELNDTELWQVVLLVKKLAPWVPFVIEIRPSAIRALGYLKEDVPSVMRDLVGEVRVA